MSTWAKVSRRSFLITSGGLLVAVNLPRPVRAAALGGAGSAQGATLNAFVHIPRTGAITLVSPCTEMGQGSYTADAQILAEELAVDLDQVRVIAAPPDEPVYKNPGLGFQETGGSYGVRGFYISLRQAGASARYQLIAAAARRWNVDASACTAKRGMIVHEASGRAFSYGALADAAAREPAPAPETLQLTSTKNFRLIGKSPRRLDTPDKANGKAIFGVDIVRPGMKIAVMISCPIIGGRLVSVDPAPALKVPGVLRVLPMPDAIAVLGEHTWAAMKGIQALDPQWGGGNPSLTTQDIEDGLKGAGENGRPDYTKTVGDPSGALDHRQGRIDAIYDVPLLAHAPMEPINAVVDLNSHGCEIWVGTQSPARAQRLACSLTGLPPEKVILHNQLMGGGFGRRLEVDGVGYAVEIAKLAGVPVKMIWTREQDFRGGMFRPAFRNIVQARLGGNNRIAGWSVRIVGGDVMAAHFPQLNVPDVDALEAASEIPYAVDSMHVDYVRKDPPVPICFWRGVGPTHNVFVVEGMIDELAEKAGVDPLEFRRRVLKEDPRLLGVLNVVAEKSGWGRPLPQGRGRGIAIQDAFGSYLSCVIDAEVKPRGDIVLHRITAVVDCGQAVNPDGVISQIEGGMIFGLSAALWGRIDIAKGEIVQSNFHNYRVMRMNETPPIEIHIIPSDIPPLGIGETGTSIVFPALASAIHAATGVRLRSHPFQHQLVQHRKSAQATPDIGSLSETADSAGQLQWAGLPTDS